MFVPLEYRVPLKSLQRAMADADQQISLPAIDIG
jgi:hypothetical protein